VTDLHIDPDYPLLLELDTKHRFLVCLQHVIGCNPDILILGGDLCHRSGSAEVYTWIYQQLTNVPFPWLAIAGNHDDAVLLATCFQQSQLVTQGEFYYTFSTYEGHLILIDSSRGHLSDAQWTWLKTQIAETPGDALVFMHHPPLQMGSLHMEPQYMFTQAEKMASLCREFSGKKIHVVTGHYHIDKVKTENNLTVYCSPSTYVQIDPNSKQFTPVKSIGYRIIEWDGRKKLSTEVGYV
jgi:Icc protein